MGAALYIVLEKNIPGIDIMIDGKMLSQLEKDLAEAAERRGVRPLMQFFSTDSDEAAALLGEEIEGIDVPPAEWFSADDGLNTVNALLAEVEASSELKAAKDDLLGCQRVLREAQKTGVRWRFAIDF
jgi:hypothetical protein